MQKLIWAAALPMVLALSGCLENDVERAAVGAGVGALAADITDNNVLLGAAIGAGVGAVSDNVARSY